MKKVYYTHDNGNRPFKVIFDVKNKICSVFILTYFINQKDYYSLNPIYVFKYEKYFIGKSPLIKMTKFSGAYGPKFDGNSILLNLKNNIYVFIGHNIIQFHSDKIKKFSSPVGNNDVPYPYAITNKNDIHLFVEEKTITIRNEPTKFSLLNNVLTILKVDINNPYEYLYFSDDIRDLYNGNIIMEDTYFKIDPSEYKSVIDQYKKTIKIKKLKFKLLQKRI